MAQEQVASTRASELETSAPAAEQNAPGDAQAPKAPSQASGQTSPARAAQQTVAVKAPEQKGKSPDQKGQARAPDRKAATSQTPVSGTVMRMADAFVEACCLVAVVLIPLYLSASSQLEVTKANILIGLAAIAAAAWLTGSVARRAARIPIWQPNPLLWAGLAVLGAYALATVLSINPDISFFGSSLRNQGLLTHLAYFVFFLCVATRLGRRAAIERLVTVAILTSLPAVIYGIAQQFGVEPVPSAGDPSTLQWPVRSSFGNHIFLGAYLVMLIPLTASRVLALRSGHADAAAEQPELDGRGKQSGRKARQRREAAARALTFGPVQALILVVAVGLAYLGFLSIGDHKPSAFFLLPAGLAVFPVLGLVLERVPSSPLSRQVWLIGYSVLLGLQILTLILTSARASIWGLLVAAVVFALLVAWRLRLVQVARGIFGLFAVAALFLLLFNISGGPLQKLHSFHSLDRIANISNYPAESSGAGRLQVWSGFWSLFADHPAIGNTWGGVGRDVVGYGPDSQQQSFDAVFPLKLRIDTAENYFVDRAHSIYLDTLAEAGLLGLLAIAALLFFFFTRVLNAIRRQDARMTWLLIGLACAVAGHFADGIFGVDTSATAIIAWVLLGIAASPAVREQEVVEAAPTRVASLDPVLIYLALWVFICAIVAALVTLTDYPRLLSSLWLGGLVVGIAVLAWTVMARPQVPAAQRPRGTTPAARTPTWLKVASGVFALLGIAAVAIPWDTQAASAAETLGFQRLTSNLIADGLTNLEAAAQLNGHVTKYPDDLSTVYFGLAGAASTTTTGLPGYVPSGDDWMTIDPQRVQLLGRSQLLQLGFLSLRAGEAITPLDAETHSMLGDAYLQWKQPDNALAEYRRAEALSHTNPIYIDDEASAYLAANRLPEALARGNAALALDNTYWYSYYTLARIYDRMGQKSQAQAEARSAQIYQTAAHAVMSPSQLKELTKLAQSG